MSKTIKRVSDLVRSMAEHPVFRRGMSPEQKDLAAFLRGNEPLMNALRALIQKRIDGRAGLPEPTDPLVCKSMMARDRELQVILNELEFVYRSPMKEELSQEDEQPAA